MPRKPWFGPLKIVKFTVALSISTRSQRDDNLCFFVGCSRNIVSHWCIVNTVDCDRGGCRIARSLAIVDGEAKTVRGHCNWPPVCRIRRPVQIPLMQAIVPLLVLREPWLGPLTTVKVKLLLSISLALSADIHRRVFVIG